MCVSNESCVQCCYNCQRENDGSSCGCSIWHSSQFLPCEEQTTCTIPLSCRVQLFGHTRCLNNHPPESTPPGVCHLPGTYKCSFNSRYNVRLTPVIYTRGAAALITIVPSSPSSQPFLCCLCPVGFPLYGSSSQRHPARTFILFLFLSLT